ncbi:MAG: AMP-binding protein [Candidatus Dormibacteraeota bacterium]|nr:AMP-binding protein [Candidatus Dormibacteraeota bacterium]
MRLSQSAHVDSFCRDRLPAAETWPVFRFDLPELAYPERVNCVEALLDRHVAAGAGGRRCLVGAESSWTYAEVLERANRVAGALVHDLGVRPGNRVLLRGPNNPWLAVCWLAVMKTGAVAVATMSLLRAGELRTIAEMAEPSLALCAEGFDDDLAAGVPALARVTFGGESGGDLGVLAAARPATFANVATAADDVCMLAFTSGTTGRPKATMHFHRDILATADTFSRHVARPLPDDLFAGSPPLAFTYGLGGLLLFPLHAGAAALLLEQASPDRLLEAVGRHGITTLYTAPTAYRAMLAALGAADVSRLRTCVSAGETLPAATWEEFHRLTGVRIIDGLGSTEMLHIFIAETPEATRPGATGRAVPGYVAEVQDPGGRPVPDGELGRLAVQGPTGCRYLGGDRQEVYVQRGWNLTGDTYVRDEQGYFHYQARADDMIISSGYNIAGPEVEEALLRHPDVAEAAVVGLPDSERGMIVKAFVVARPGAGRSAEAARALQDFVKAEIAPYKYPRALDFVDALPRTATGKLQRFRLRD